VAQLILEMLVAFGTLVETRVGFARFLFWSGAAMTLLAATSDYAQVAALLLTLSILGLGFATYAVAKRGAARIWGSAAALSNAIAVAANLRSLAA